VRLPASNWQGPSVDWCHDNASSALFAESLFLQHHDAAQKKDMLSEDADNSSACACEQSNNVCRNAV